MKEFTYVDAKDKNSVLEALAAGNGWPVAGCTNVLLDIHAGKKNNVALVNLKNAQDLRYIKEEGGKIILGATTTIADLEHSELIKAKAPALNHAACVFADPTTRNTATVGGNICNASPAADTAPALLALEAEVVIEKQGASRKVALKDFFKGVGKTVVEADEIVTAIEFAPNPHSSFIKIGLRTAMAISVANAAVALDCQNGKVAKAAIAMGSVAPTPVRCANAEAAVIGKSLAEAISAVGAALEKDICPIDDVRAKASYRRAVAGTIVGRCLKAACGCQEGGAK